MIYLRPFIAILLSLSVVLTSGAMAVARGQAQAGVGQMTLCTGYGPKTVAVDKDGQPVAPSHFCPDCALAAFFMPGQPAIAPHSTLRTSLLVAGQAQSLPTLFDNPEPIARGPPLRATI